MSVHADEVGPDRGGDGVDDFLLGLAAGVSVATLGFVLDAVLFSAGCP